MKPYLLLTALTLTVVSCQQKAADSTSATDNTPPLTGTWTLISDRTITKGDTVVNYPDKNNPTEMIKMYNGTHFAFFQHDLVHGKQAKPFYSSGAGTYTLKGDDYTEKLEYCDAREWEGHDFKFKLTVKNDTLVQTGIEKIDSLNVNHTIIEKYVRKK